MHSTKKITDRILNEAGIEAKAVIEAAKAEAEANLKVAQLQADTYAKQAAEETAKAVAEQKKRKLSAIDSELRKEVLAVRRKLLDSAFEEALLKLANMSVEKKIAMLVPRILEASPLGKGEILMNKNDASEYGSQLVKAANLLYNEKGISSAIKLSDKEINARGGMILKIDDIEYNNTFDALVKAAKEELESNVMSALFNEGAN